MVDKHRKQGRRNDKMFGGEASKHIKTYQNGSKRIKKYQNTSNVSKGDYTIFYFLTFNDFTLGPWNFIPVLGAVKNYKCSHLFFHISISLFGPAYIFVLKIRDPIIQILI